MRDRLRLLLVEDEESDAELLSAELEQAGMQAEIRRVDTEDAYLSALRHEPWDVIVSDYAMPRFSGRRAFELYRACDLDTPFIFVSGALGEERAVEAMRAGARDYFLKGNIARLPEAIRREVTEARNRAERRRAEEETRREQRRLSLAVEATNAAIFELITEGGPRMHYGGGWRDLLGYLPEELPSHEQEVRYWLQRDLHPEDRTRLAGEMAAFDATAEPRFQAEVRLRHRDGRWIDVAVYARAAERDADGHVRRLAGVVLDLTGRRQLELQLRQAQKMEAVGRLAGGVAHDFNNLLTAIFSFGQFVLESLDENSPERADMLEVLGAAERAKRLTAQLLAFSRRKPVTPRIVSLNEVVTGVQRLVQRLLGEDVALDTTLCPDLWNVRLDPDAFEQVLLNLAVNARDAMPRGGRLHITTTNRMGDGPPSPDWVVVEVADNGVGMDAETQARLFEPFFTTKEAGRGTGLGLATSYGIVSQAGGRIQVESQLGHGTTFIMQFPRAAAPRDTPIVFERTPDPSGSETVLIAEDDPQVRHLAARVLRRYGYDVHEAADGAEALRVAERLVRRPALLVTDVIMPQMSGKELAERLRQHAPALRVLYMSGYTHQVIADHGVLETGLFLLGKPFTPDLLVAKVREVLESVITAQ